MPENSELPKKLNTTLNIAPKIGKHGGGSLVLQFENYQEWV